jgi:type IV pilus assembly protein PilP
MRLSAAATISFLCAGLFAVTACDDEEDEIAVPVRASKKDKSKDDQKSKDGDKAEQLAYSYDAVSRRDPFKTYFDELLLEEQEQENRTELQRFELDKLKLVAVVVGTATPMAMLEDPTGKGHTVRIGTLVGRRFGIVKYIRHGEIVVQEEFRDFTGKRIPVLKPIRLSPEGT